MGDSQKMSATEFTRMAQVLDLPEHVTGLEEGELVVDTIQVLSSTFMRIRGQLQGFRHADAWRKPNTTLRLEVPISNDAISDMDTSSRVYTVAEMGDNYDITIDAVRHDADSPMMRWLASAQPGDRMVVKGPRQHQILQPGVKNYMFADASALPAVRNIIKNQPMSIPPTVVITAPMEDAQTYLADCHGLADMVYLETAKDVVDACRELNITSTTTVWAAGERDQMRMLRNYCKAECGVARSALRIFGYWKRGTSHTLLDIARLQAVKQRIDSGLNLELADDFDLEI